MILRDKIREFMLLRSRNKDFRPHEYHGLEAVSSVAIAFESGPNDRLIHDFGQKLQALGKQVNYLGYVPKNRKELQNIPWFHHFTKNELSWYGKPKSEEVRQFVKPHYGVYISFNTKPGSPLQFVNAGIGADFSIGLQHPSFTRFDLVVGQGEEASLQEVFKEMEYYLNFINRRT